MGFLLQLSQLCGSLADNAVRSQCKGILQALEGFRLRQINDVHMRMIETDRDAYCQVSGTTRLNQLAAHAASLNAMPTLELSFMLATLICYHQCQPEDFIADIKTSDNRSSMVDASFTSSVIEIITNGDPTYIESLRTIGTIRRAIPGTWSDHLLTTYFDRISEPTKLYQCLLEFPVEESHPEDFDIQPFINFLLTSPVEKDWRWRHILTTESLTVEQRNPLATFVTLDHLSRFIKY